MVWRWGGGLGIKFRFLGGITCVLWFEFGRWGKLGDDFGKLAGVDGIKPLLRDRDRKDELSVACSMSCYIGAVCGAWDIRVLWLVVVTGGIVGSWLKVIRDGW